MTDWNTLKVTDLRAELKKRGLPQTGLKQALVARLTNAEAEASDSEATIQDDVAKLDTNAATSPDTASPVLPSPDVPATIPVEDIPIQTVPEIEQTTETPQIIDESAIPDSIHKEPSPSTESTPIPSTTEPLSIPSIDTPVSSQPVEQKDAHTSALPSVEPQEALEDRQKRKRRSQTPPVLADDVAKKRRRMSEKIAEDEDKIATADWAEKQTSADIKIVASTAIALVKDTVAEEGAKDKSVAMEKEGAKREGALDTTPDDDFPARSRDSRFKKLFAEDKPQSSSSTMPSAIRDLVVEKPDRSISPAIHTATAAIYIRNFKRPLTDHKLKAHLASLAAPPGASPDPDVVVSLYLDPIKTHAFVAFANISAASRVRSALHDRKWPEEDKTRMPLWIDFIPVDMIAGWVEEEQKGGRSPKKFEIYYDTTHDGPATAHLQEVGQPVGQRSKPLQPTRMPLGPPSGPPTRGFEAQQMSQPTPAGIHPSRLQFLGIQASVGTSGSVDTGRLDQLFKSTESKPKLYFQPVSKELADKRLDVIDRALSKDARDGRRLSGEVNRYTFQNGDELVDRGPEIFSGIRPPQGYRGPGRGGGQGGPSRGPRRDGFRDRRDGGPGYGGGGRGYGGGSGGFERRSGYDSYRGGGNGGGRDYGRNDRY